METKNLKYISKNFSIKDLLELIDKNKLDFDSSYRYENIDQEDFNIHLSKFIESAIIRFPIEPVWLLLDNNNHYSVIKGHKKFVFIDQFLVAGKGFVKLKKLTYLSKLNEASYLDLSRNYQRKIEEYLVPCYIVMPETPGEVIWDIYQRLK